MVPLGDRRVIHCVGPCWRYLSPEGRQQLLQLVRGRSYAGLIDWLVSWLEECEGNEFGAVAGVLAAIPNNAQPAEVTDVRRALPVWSVASDEVITVLSRSSFADYGKTIRPRLLQIAADEQAPRVMHDVLKSWGIDHTQRVCDGAHGNGTTPTHRSQYSAPVPGGYARCRVVDSCGAEASV